MGYDRDESLRIGREMEQDAQGTNVFRAYNITSQSSAKPALLSAEEQIATLEQWKREAIVVINEWEKVGEAVKARESGKLGESVAKITLERVHALTAERDTAKNMFWPPQDSIEEHIYEIRNGKTADYVREHARTLCAESAERTIAHLRVELNDTQRELLGQVEAWERRVEHLRTEVIKPLTEAGANLDAALDKVMPEVDKRIVLQCLRAGVNDWGGGSIQQEWKSLKAALATARAELEKK